MKAIAILDFETTGLSVERDQVIEGAIEVVEVLDGDRLGAVIDSYESLNFPGDPIPPAITKLTGISDAMVEGKRLDWSRFTEVGKKADLLIAHNARFDRAWYEKNAFHQFATWACSSTMIDWRGRHGMPCGNLKHLAWEHQFFPNAHRAKDDVDTVIELLRKNSRADESRTYFKELLSHYRMRSFVLYANQAPIEKKDLLRGKGFRWSSSRRVWWKLVRENDLPNLKAFLAQDIYSASGDFSSLDPVDPLLPLLEEKLKLK